jgi:glycosyltransferase involved in cell wall biosynthesis
MSSRLALSLIVPAYNEVESVAPLYDAIIDALEPLALSFEIIFVDDGSTDGTFERCAALAARDERVKVLKLRKNCGQTAGMFAGIDHASGDVLITMDADLQNDPADIPVLLEKIDQGYDLVVGWRRDRQDKLFSKKLPSVIANWLIGKVTGIAIRDNGCTLKAYRADLIKRVTLYAEMHRFIPAMTSIRGARIAEVEVRHHPRRFGRSKYGLSRIYKVVVDLMAVRTLLVFAKRPLFCFAGAASIAALVSVLCLVAALVDAIGRSEAPTIVFMGMSILAGSLAVFLALLGMIGYLVYRLASETSAVRPMVGRVPGLVARERAAGRERS